MSLRTLEEIGLEIQRLRRERGPNAHLPDELRKALVEFDARHGPGRILRELGVPRESLRRWRMLFGAPVTSYGQIPPPESIFPAERW